MKREYKMASFSKRCYPKIQNMKPQDIKKKKTLNKRYIKDISKHETTRYSKKH